MLIKLIVLSISLKFMFLKHSINKDIIVKSFNIETFLIKYLKI